MKTKLFLSIFMILILFTSYLAQSNVVYNGNSYYFADRIVVQLDSKNYDQNGKVNIQESLFNKLKNFGVTNIKNRFEFNSDKSIEATALNKIVVMELSSPIDPLFLSGKLSKLKGVNWAEPQYIHELFYTPNDPSTGSQYAIAKVQAEQAWDITKGDSTIIIAINDTGVDWNHPDLFDNIWVNNDPVNGVDDDGNGYVDDINGWDFGGLTGTPDNNPVEDRPDHGTHVAGIAGAVTDNGIGVASLGFDCTIMPVKTSRDDVRNASNQALISYGYEGIIYAADNGADIINCSWGSFSYSNSGQAAVTYARSKGTLVVAAAGNNNVSNVLFPSNYDGAFCVGSTDQSDKKSSFSNYGVDVEVMAPGSAIYATWFDDTYTFLQGTSMASPLVAGLAGLVKSQFPTYTPDQIAEQIRVNSDNIDAVNTLYAYKLGAGRVNAFKAVSNTNSISVRTRDFIVEDAGDGDGILEAGEDINVKLKLLNYLSPTTNLTISAVYTGSAVSITSGSFAAGAVATLDSTDNYNSPLTLKISDTVPQNTTVQIRLDYSDGSYTDFQWFSFLVNPTYATQSGNEIAMTITSKGTFGYNNYSTNTQGLGFKFENGPNLLYEGALIYGTSANKVSDAARGTDPNTQSGDFKVLTPFILEQPGSIADQQGEALFNDDNAGLNKVGIESKLMSYSFSDSPDDKYIILKYEFKNTTGSNISDFYAGLFFDWDIDGNAYETNMIKYDSTDNFGYAYNQDSGVIDDILTVALISDDKHGFYAITNDGTNGSIDIYDNFTKAEKWQMISGGISRPESPAGDIGAVTSAGPYSIVNGESIIVAFVIAADNNLEGLRNSVQASKLKYQQLPTSLDDDKNKVKPLIYSLTQNYPNPFNPATTIKYSIKESENVSLTIYNSLGEQVKTLVNTFKAAGSYSVNFDASNLSSGIYFYTLRAGNYIQTKKMILLK